MSLIGARAFRPRTLHHMQTQGLLREAFERCELTSDSAGIWNQSDCDSKKSASPNHPHTIKSSSSITQEEEKLLDELKVKCGIPFTLTTQGKVKKLTEWFWANYVMRKHELHKGDGVIWQYDGKTGLWNMVGPEDLNDLIGSTAHAYGTSYGYEELGA